MDSLEGNKIKLESFSSSIFTNIEIIRILIIYVKKKKSKIIFISIVTFHF